MGGYYWEYQTPYQPDAGEALRRLQAEVFRQNGYDLAKMLDGAISNMVKSVKLCELDDEYNLLETYRGSLRELRRLAAQGVPSDVHAQITLLRDIEAQSSAAAPDILAIETISNADGYRMAERLSPERMLQIFGTAAPTLEQARAGIEKIIAPVWTVCFPVYLNEKPVTWFFAGCTWD